LAGDSGCAFFYKSGSEFDELYVGVAAKRIKALFEEARKHTPAIIFIDEIDSIAGKRNINEMQTYNEAINQILTEMDGFKQNEKLIVIGATNLEQS
jgi:ATP-dependent metalloprotease